MRQEKTTGAFWMAGLLAAFLAAEAFGLPPTLRTPGTMGGSSMASASPSSGSSILRIKQAPKEEALRTPLYKTSLNTSSTSPKTWWHGVMEYETAPEWIDELEFTYYVYIEDAKTKTTPMFRATVTYVNIPKGKHLSDVFLHPDTLARYGKPKFIAVVVKHQGAVVAQESTASSGAGNWWDRFSPIDGVLLPRSMTPFAVLDYDDFPSVKMGPATR